ncbi:MAG: type I polyketide synthase, partial [Planctomycetaceae bacterium]|nr:type I polyketide synthase [Planctomycetaceae bacterium]
LLLEVAFEAIEHAGLAPQRLDGSSTGVFVGISGVDYSVLSSQHLESVGAYFGTGTSHSTASGRLSYILGLQGPSLSVDTACSSSLVAMHLACQSVARGECEMAIVGGVSLVIVPEVMVSFSKAQMLSADGRCKTFDAAADGYGRGEGVGVVLVKRLSAALRDHDRILGVVRGTAVNQDGKSSGLTVPSGPAQERVIRAALQAGQIAPTDVSYVEAHGTGTPLGDSIELGALQAVYGTGRQSPLVVGSVKTNIGHAEAASGVAAMIKVLLALQHGVIPPHLHFKQPNPNVAWDGMHVPTQLTPWQADERPRIAGVSSFGFGGTNAHVVIAEPPARLALPTNAKPRRSRPAEILNLSAKQPAALKELAARYAAQLEGADDATFTAICDAAALARSHAAHRLSIVATDAVDARAKLTAFFAGKPTPGVISGEIHDPAPKLAGLFTGQGSQYANMGRELFDTQPTFRRALERCDELLRPYLAESLLSVIYPESGKSPLLDQTEYTQPALFALEYSLWELWRSWGVEPTVLMGHSVGEYVAACVAGVFDLADGLRLIATRARLMQSLPAGGTMAAIMAPVAWVEQAVSDTHGLLDIAAINGPRQVVVSGPIDAVTQLVARAEAENFRAKQLTVSHAFHSHLLEPMLDDFYAVASSVEFRAPTRTIISNLTGEPAGAELATPEYWRQHLRRAVQFAKSAETAAKQGCQLFIEYGPAATLSAMARQCVADERIQYLPSLTGRGGDWQSLLGSLAALHVAGVNVNWDALYDRRVARSQTLPSYPFQRQRYWIPESSAKQGSSSSTQSTVTATSAVVPAAKPGHPLIGQPIRLSTGGVIVEHELSALSSGYLIDHQVRGRPIFPAAGYLEAFVAIGQTLARGRGVKLRSAQFARPLALSTDRAKPIQIVCTPSDDGLRGEFFRHDAAHDGGEPSWTMHSTAIIDFGVTEATPVSLDSIRYRLDVETPQAAYYAHMRESGLEYGPAFQGLAQVWRGPGEALGRWSAPAALLVDLPQYTLHPALLDAAFQVVGAVMPDASSGTFLPVGVEELEIYAPLDRDGYSHVQLRPAIDGRDDVIIADLDLFSATGQPLVRIAGFRLQRVGKGGAKRAAKPTPAASAAPVEVNGPSLDAVYEVVWQPQAMPVPRSLDTAGTWLLVSEPSALCDELAQRLRHEGQRAVIVNPGTNPQPLVDDRAVVDGSQPNDFARLLGELTDEFLPPLVGVVLLTPAGDCQTLLHITQALGRESQNDPPQLWIVTRDAVRAVEGDAVTGVEQSPLWGLAGVVAAENPEWRVTRLDFDSTSDGASQVALVMSELTAADIETQVAYRGGERVAARLQHPTPRIPGKLTRPTGPFRLRLSEYGVLENLTLDTIERKVPGPGEIEIAVDAAGLNFRDVLRALGMLQEYEAPLGITSAEVAPFGFECAGVVSAVGPGVEAWQIGQPVFGVALGSLSSHVITRANQVTARPASLSPVEAATIPLAFLTASYGLEMLVGLQPGQRVLIHAAAGGVGLAAVQIAQRAGAEVWATASPGKWALLQRLGVKHVFNSRTTDFGEQIRAAGGVDVVLNSLNGDFIPASLVALRPGGAFVEIGKIGIRTADEMAQERPDVRYFAFDLGEVEEREPGMMGRLLEQLTQRFVRGELRPLEHQTLDITAAVGAFRHIAQAKHRGKVVLTLTENAHRLHLRDSGWYVVTGGLGSLGLRTAAWLVERGAKQLLLLGRRPPDADQRQALAALSAKGVEIRTAAVNVSDRAALSAVLSDLPGPLHGVIHAAGVLDDGMLRSLDWSRFQRVLEPKVLGARNLHELAQGQPLDFFVCFSSAAALLGSPGQGNYAAANAYLDALMQQRRAQGLPGLSVNWGPWAESGMAARLDERQRRRLADMGLGLIDVADGFALLERLITGDTTQAAVMPIEWSRFLRYNRFTPYYELIATRPVENMPSAASTVSPNKPAPQPTPQSAPIAAPAGGIVARLGALAASERLGGMIDFLRTEIAAVLGFEPSAISPRGRLFDLGMDSLTAVELLNRLKRALNVELPTTLAFDYPTVEALATFLLDRLTLDTAAPPSAHAPDTPLESQVEQYSDADIAALLEQKYGDMLNEGSR